MRGEVKLAVMKIEATSPDVLACSIYDTDPLQIISTVDVNANWNTMKKKVYIKIKKNIWVMKFHRLNAIHMYNFVLGSVDVADQIFVKYRPYH